LVELLARGVSEWNDARPSRAAKPDLTHLAISHADLRDANFSNTNFDGTTFVDVDLRGARFNGARLNGVNMSRVCLEGADLRDTELKGTDLKHVNLRGAKLDRATAFELKVRHSTLENASLTETRLRWVHLYNSDLRSARLEPAAAEHVVLKRVVSESGSRGMPDGVVIELDNQPTPEEWLDWSRFDARAGDGLGSIVHAGKAYWISEGRWDFFISHASVDKKVVAQPLAAALSARAMRVWYDEVEVKIGDDLAKVIGFGTRASLFGVVILSRDFFGRRWTEAELAALWSKRVFVVLHGVAAQELRTLRPEIEDRVCLSSELGAERLADELLAAVRAPPREL
jgi:hypothetical protein